MSKIRFAFHVLLAFLPSKAKVIVLNALGHEIHSSAYIGFSVLDIDHIAMGPETYIGHGNTFKNLPRLTMRLGSRINRWNKFTSNRMPNSELLLEERASIALRHYFDVCARVSVGHDTIIAGHHSTFFTHSKGIDEIDFARGIKIGEWCYLGSGLNVSPGTQIGHHCFIGMGAVLAGDKSKLTYALLVGNPAQKKKDIDPECAYFAKQEKIIHGHMKQK